jgi:transcription antitermination factor NusG
VFDESAPADGSDGSSLFTSPLDADGRHEQNSPQETRSKRSGGGKRSNAGRPKGRKTRSQWRKPTAPVVYEPFSGLRWYVCRVQHPYEEDAASELDKLGVERLLPLEEVRLVRKNRIGANVTEDVKRPLYPTYLFIHIDASVYPWQQIAKKCQFVHEVICTGPMTERPFPLPEGLIEALARDLKLDAAGIVSRLPPKRLPKIASGAKVTLIGDHPLSGRDALVRWSSARSVRLWLNGVGKVEVPQRLVELAA